MYTKVRISELNFGSLFKICFLCGTLFWVIMGLFALLLSVTIPSALTINGEQATGIGDGIQAMFLFPIVGALVSALVAVIGASVLKQVAKKISFGDLLIENTDEQDVE